MAVQQPPTALTVTIADGAAISGAFDLTDFIGGIVIIPDSWTDANMGFKVCETQTGTFVILRDNTGVPVQISGIITNAANAYKIPDDIFPARWVKLWSKNTTAATVTDNNQTGAISPVVMLK